MVFLIACVDVNNGIQKGGRVPWVLKPDLERLCQMTTDSVIIMNRDAWDNIGSRPLMLRTNIVVAADSADICNDIVCASLQDAMDKAIRLLRPIYIIGGEELFEEALKIASNVYITRINTDFECDKFFPFKKMKHKFSEVKDWKVSDEIIYRFETYYL